MIVYPDVGENGVAECGVRQWSEVDILRRYACTLSEINRSSGDAGSFGKLHDFHAIYYVTMCTTRGL